MMAQPITQEIYRRSIDHFWTWARVAHDHEEHYPVPPELVAEFLLQHLRPDPELDRRLVEAGAKRDPGPMALATLKLRLIALDQAHTQRALAPPSKAPLVQLHLERHTRQYNKARSPTQPRAKRPITADILDQLLATCDRQHLLGLRDHALLSVAYAAARPGIVTQLLHLEIQELEHDAESALYRCPALDLVLTDPAASSLRRWLHQLAEHAHVHGLVFRAITPKGDLPAEARPMSAAAVTKIIQRRAKIAGLKGRFYGASSFGKDPD